MLLISSVSFAQEDLSSFSINPQLTKEALKEQLSDFKVYRVKQKEIEYHPYVEGQVNTREYNLLLERLDEYKPEYDKYKQSVLLDSISRKDLKSIKNNINLYLFSTEKADVKDKYLIEAQSIADKHNLVIEGENKSFLAKKINDYGRMKNTTKIFRLHNGRKSSSKKDIEFYKGEIEKIKLAEVAISHEAKKYIELLENEKTIQKTQQGKVLSTEIAKRKAFLIDGEIDINTLNGLFIELPEQYMLAEKDFDNELVINELSSNSKFSGTYGMSQRYPLINKKDTNEYYYIVSSSFLSSLTSKQKEQELVEIVNKMGYKVYKSDDRYDENLYIKSKTAEIKLDNRTYHELKSNPNYISNLDSDQAKIAVLVKQTVSHSNTLDKYLSQYNIQKRNMSTSSIESWRKATANAQNLLTQINKLSEKYEGNYSFTLLNKSNSLNIFLDNLLASKGVLGM